MNSKIKLISVVFLVFSFCFLFVNLSSVSAQTCPTKTATFPPPGCDCKGAGNLILVCNAAGIVQAQELLTRIINISVTLAFMAVTVWLVWGALKFFITSGGDPKALAHAWSSVTWTFMGLFFMVLAWLSLKLILAVTGADVTKYCLGFPPYCV